MDDWQLLDEAGVAAARPEYDAAMDAYWNARKARIAEHAAIDAQSCGSTALRSRAMSPRPRRPACEA